MGSAGVFEILNVPEPKLSCRTPGISYTITCMKCGSQNVAAVYQGESSKNAFARGKKHLSELKSACRNNSMVIYNSVHHQQEPPTSQNFQMKILRFIRRPMDRQIEESIRIKDSTADILMNSGAEWRSDRIPRAKFQVQAP